MGTVTIAFHAPAEATRALRETDQTLCGQNYCPHAVTTVYAIGQRRLPWNPEGPSTIKQRAKRLEECHCYLS